MKKYIPVLCILTAAVVGAVLRSFQLTALFDTNLGLIERFHPLTIALVIFCLLAALTMVLPSLRKKPLEQANPSEPSMVPSPGKVWFVLDVIACICLLLSGFLLIGRGMAHSNAALFIYALLTLATAIGLFFFANAARTNRLRREVHGFVVTLSVFWGCYALIMDYWSRAGDPEMQSFAYGMLAQLFGSLALLAVGNLIYGGGRPGRAKVYASLALFLSVLTLGGIVLAVLTKNPGAIKGIFDPFANTAEAVSPSFIDILGASKLISATTADGIGGAAPLLPRAATPWTDALLRLAFIAFHSAALLLCYGGRVFHGLEPKTPPTDVSEAAAD